MYFNWGLLYLTVASYEEAVQKEEISVKELKEKFEAKILENKVYGLAIIAYIYIE